MNYKEKHQRWLLKKNLHPTQIKKRKKELGREWNYVPYVSDSSQLSNSIPSNGTKEADMSKAKFSQENYALVPAFNKGPIQPFKKQHLKDVGKK